MIKDLRHPKFFPKQSVCHSLTVRLKLSLALSFLTT